MIELAVLILEACDITPSRYSTLSDTPISRISQLKIFSLPSDICEASKNLMIELLVPVFVQVGKFVMSGQQLNYTFYDMDAS